MSDKRTHWRSAYKSIYLGCADISTETVLTIARVALEPDKTKKSKESFNTAYFVETELPDRPGEAIKPWILNVGNAELVRKFSGNKDHIEDWKNIKVTIFPDLNVKFGKETVGGLRIAPVQPVKLSLEVNSKAWANAVAAYKRDGNASAIEKHMDISPAVMEKLAQAAAD